MDKRALMAWVSAKHTELRGNGLSGIGTLWQCVVLALGIPLMVVMESVKPWMDSILGWPNSWA